MRARHGIEARSGCIGLARALGVACLWFAARADASVQYRLAFDGLNAGWREATGFDHAITRTLAGVVKHNDLRIVRPVDQISPALAARVCQGTPLARVRLEILETRPEGVRYFAIRMGDVLVTSCSVSNTGGGDTPRESLSFNYGKIEWTRIETDAGGHADSSVSAMWDTYAGGGGAHDPDSDDDGMPDSYEIAERLKPLEDDADEDADTDSLTNLKEYWAGTSAGSADSVFKLTSIGIPGNGNVTVTFSSVPGREYDIYADTTVTGLIAAETPLATVTASDATTTADLSLPEPRAFVKVRVRPR